jgi:O-antigen biosynthesis protein
MSRSNSSQGVDPSSLPPSGARRPIVVVLAMHRSGSSVVTRGLQALGVDLGDNLMPPAAQNNERGFFEDLDIYRFNERLLEQAGSTWHKLAPLDGAVLSGPDFSPQRRQAAALLSGKLGTGVFGFKDPRTAVLLPFWQCVFDDLDLDDRYVIAVRNPIECAVSLEARDGVPLSKGVLLWARHLVESARHTESKPRIFVSYDRMLDDPVGELRRMAAALGLGECDFESDAIREYRDEFLSRNLRHHRIGVRELARSGLASPFVIELYGLLDALTAEREAVLDGEAWRSILARYQELAPVLVYADRFDALAAQLREVEAARAAALADVDRLAAEAQREAEERRAASARLRELEAAHEHEIRTLSAELQSSSRALTEARARLSELEALIREDAERRGALEVQARETERAHAAEREELAGRVEQLRGEVERLAAENERLGTDGNAASAAHEQEIRTLSAELQTSSRALTEARARLSELEALIREGAERRGALEVQARETERAHAAEREELAGRVEQLRGEVERLAAENERLGTDGNAARAAHEHEIRTLSAELQNSSRALMEARARLSELEAAQAKQKAVVEVAQREAAAMSALLAQKSKQLDQLAVERDQLAEAMRGREALSSRVNALERRFRDARRDLLLARAALTEMRRSTSWRLTAPLRAAASIARNPVAGSRAALGKLARAAWRSLPMSAKRRGRLAARMFAAAPALFFWSSAFKTWRAGRDGRSVGASAAAEPAEPPPDPALEGYVPLLASEPPQSAPVRAIAFYLPQFHPIPENDAWWGEGFTEWTKVKAAQPCFDGHYQPHEPGELGYYDLLTDDGVMERQAELAKLHGIHGFCFYFYWFGGVRLLEAPIQKYHQSKIETPFCLCWANENWTRRWDGADHEVLIAQKHSPEDDIAFIRHVSQYFSDSRYIRINGRPLLIVYRPALLPAAKETAERWRRWLRENGLGEVYLAYVQSFERAPPADYGFDAAIEFPPNNMGLVSEPGLAASPRPGSRLSVYDWRKLSARRWRYDKPAYTLFRGVNPSWDNTPRRPTDGAVFVNTSPSAFRDWMAHAVRDTVARFADPEERLVFINAWNEWAEGAHLEPDRKHGYAWLEAVRRALDPAAEKRKLVVVTHDLQRHGAQLLALNLLRTLRRHFGFEVAAISAQHGPLAPDYEKEGSLTILDPLATPESNIEAAIGALAARGFRHAIVNSAASAWIAPRLARHGVKMFALVHELPSVIARMGLARGLVELDRQAEAMVFPAAAVRDRDAAAAGLSAWRNAQVAPQGLYKAGVVTDLRRKEEARRRVAARLGLPDNAKIVLGVGFADERKGVDIFIAWAAAAARRWPHLHFVWLGEVARDLRHKLERWLAGAGAQRSNIHFPGYAEDTAEFYAAAGLYALSSREDPFPSTALEALAAATPVITVKRTGGVEELAAHGCVRAIDSAEAADFVAAAAAWIEDEAAARNAGERGRDLIREKFGFVSYAGALADLMGLDVPNVSVVVPNYNYARCLEQRLESILEQTLAPREILVLDDASTDDSIAVAERVLAGSPINWRIVRNAQNSGDVFGQWRKGVELAQGDLVWIAEADDWADPRFLEMAARPFRRGDVVLSMTQSHQAGGDGRILAGDYLDYVRDVSAQKWTRAFVGDGEAEVREGLSVKNTIPNVSAALLRRSALLETLREHAAEIGSYRVAGDWCVYVNLLRKGALAFSPAALNCHRRHDDSVTISRFGLPELAEIARMQAYVAREFAPGPEQAHKARAYLDQLVAQFELERRYSRAQIEGALRGVVEAPARRA